MNLVELGLVTDICRGGQTRTGGKSVMEVDWDWRDGGEYVLEVNSNRWDNSGYVVVYIYLVGSGYAMVVYGLELAVDTW